MAFYNIFSSEKDSAVINKSNAQILVDIHEKNSLVPAELSKINAVCSFKRLEIGDYQINDLIIERKTINDLQSSILDKRIFQQLKNLKSVSKGMLIIEGSYKDSKKVLHLNAIKGFMLSVLLKTQIPIIQTENEKDTANYLFLISQKKDKQDFSLRPKKLPEKFEEQQQFILEGFPKIGPAKAKELLKKFGSLKNIFNAQEDELKQVLKKDSELFLKLLYKDSLP